MVQLVAASPISIATLGPAAQHGAWLDPAALPAPGGVPAGAPAASVSLRLPPAVLARTAASECGLRVVVLPGLQPAPGVDALLDVTLAPGQALWPLQGVLQLMLPGMEAHAGLLMVHILRTGLRGLAAVATDVSYLASLPLLVLPAGAADEVTTLFASMVNEWLQEHPSVSLSEAAGEVWHAHFSQFTYDMAFLMQGAAAGGQAPAAGLVAAAGGVQAVQQAATAAAAAAQPSVDAVQQLGTLMMSYLQENKMQECAGLLLDILQPQAPTPAAGLSPLPASAPASPGLPASVSQAAGQEAPVRPQGRDWSPAPAVVAAAHATAAPAGPVVAAPGPMAGAPAAACSSAPVAAAGGVGGGAARAALWGFGGAREAAYQQYKAASLSTLDCFTLVMDLVRLVALVVVGCGRLVGCSASRAQPLCVVGLAASALLPTVLYVACWWKFAVWRGWLLAGSRLGRGVLLLGLSRQLGQAGAPLVTRQPVWLSAVCLVAQACMLRLGVWQQVVACSGQLAGTSAAWAVAPLPLPALAFELACQVAVAVACVVTAAVNDCGMRRCLLRCAHSGVGKEGGASKAKCCN